MTAVNLRPICHGSARLLGAWVDFDTRRKGRVSEVAGGRRRIIIDSSDSNGVLTAMQLALLVSMDRTLSRRMSCTAQCEVLGWGGLLGRM